MASPPAVQFPSPEANGHFAHYQSGSLPRLRPSTSRTGMASTTARARDDARGRYSHISTESFSDEFYHTSKRGGRWAALTAFPAGVYKLSVARFGRRRGPALLCFCCLALLLSTFALHKRFVSGEKTWPVPWGKSKSVVFDKEQLRKIWDWEVRAGHYPSTRPSESCFSFVRSLLVLPV